MEFDKIINCIKEFGFTTYESKILAYLLLKTEATAPEMSEKLQIPSTKIYYVLDKLFNNGFIKRKETVPVIYFISDKESFFENVIRKHKEKLDHLIELKDNILKSLSFTTPTKVIVSYSEFIYFLSLNLNNVFIVCGKFTRNLIGHLSDKRSISNIVCLDEFPLFILLSDEIFLFGIFNGSNFSVGFVTSECLDRFKFIKNV